MGKNSATVVAGLAFGSVFGVVMGFTSGPTAGIAAGVVAGLLFGAAMGFFATVQRTRLEARDAIFEGEPVLHQGPANHGAGVESRGGWLVLTASRLAFRAHGFNVQNHPLDLALHDIEHAETTRTLGLVPNGLRIVGRDGRDARFVVRDRDAWVRAVAQARGAS